MNPHSARFKILDRRFAMDERAERILMMMITLTYNLARERIEARVLVVILSQ